jgi:hypothetical protein
MIDYVINVSENPIEESKNRFHFGKSLRLPLSIPAVANSQFADCGEKSQLCYYVTENMVHQTKIFG